MRSKYQMIIPFAVAVGVIAAIAWVLVTHAEPRRRDERTRTRRRASRARRARSPAPPSPVTLETPATRVRTRSEPVQDLVMSGGGEAVTADGPVLAYLEQPRWAPRADRYLDAEVMVPTGWWYRLLALARLILALVTLGVAFGLGVILAARVVIWFVQTALG